MTLRRSMWGRCIKTVDLGPKRGKTMCKGFKLFVRITCSILKNGSDKLRQILRGILAFGCNVCKFLGGLLIKITRFRMVKRLVEQVRFTFTKHKTNFDTLSPQKDVELGFYEKAIDYALHTKDVLNIGLLGAYGSGKSSILETYLYKHGRKYLRVSISEFVDSVSSNEYDEKDLEGRIINHLLLQIPGYRILGTSFRKKGFSQFVRCLVLAASISIILIIVISSVWTDNLNLITGIGYKQKSYLFISALLILVFDVVFSWVIRNHNHNIKLKDVEISLFPKDDDLHFDKYFDEIVYLISHCGCRIVVFEDLDRFNSVEILKKIREINIAVNYLKLFKVRFIYLVRDDLFSVENRTKFFDYIIPVIPYVNGQNSYERIKVLLQKYGIEDEVDDNLLHLASVYIDDARCMNSICNEYRVIREQLEATSYTSKLFALVIYKCLFPKDFYQSTHFRGLVGWIFKDGKKNIIEIAEAKYDKEIEQKTTNESDEDENLVLEREELVQMKKRLKYMSAAQLFSVCGYDELWESVLDEIRDQKGTCEATKDVLYSEKNNLIKNLIIKGYIDECYIDYLSYWSNVLLSEGDRQFVYGIYNGNNTPNEVYNIGNAQLVTEYLGTTELERKGAINHTLLDYLLSHADNNSEKLDALIRTISKEKKYEFIKEHLLQFSNDTIFLNLIAQNHPKLLLPEEIISHGYDIKDVEFYLYAMVSTGAVCFFKDEDCKQIIKTEIEKAKFIYNPSKELLDYHDLTPQTLEKACKFLRLQIENIDFNDCNKNLLDVIVNGRYYAVNLQNVLSILEQENNLQLSQVKRLFITLVYSYEKNGKRRIIYRANHLMKELIENEKKIRFTDNPEIVRCFLLEDDISDDIKKMYVSHHRKELDMSIEELDVVVTTELLASGVLKFSFENAWIYYKQNDNVINEYLLSYVNTARKLRIDEKARTDYKILFKALLLNNSIDLPIYRELLGNCNIIFSETEVRGLDEQHLTLLIEAGVVKDSVNLHLRIRSEFGVILAARLACQEIDSYIYWIPNYLTEDSREIIEILKSDVEFSKKKELLNKCRCFYEIDPVNYDDEINEEILRNRSNLDVLDSAASKYGILSDGVKEAYRHATKRLCKDGKLTNAPRILIQEFLLYDNLSPEEQKEMICSNADKLNKQLVKTYLKQSGNVELAKAIDGHNDISVIADKAVEHLITSNNGKKWLVGFRRDGNYVIFNPLQND